MLASAGVVTTGTDFIAFRVAAYGLRRYGPRHRSFHQGRLMQAQLAVRAVTVIAVIMLGTSCSGSSTNTESSAPAAQVPTTTKRVYLATALACSKLEGQSARFTPLKVSGPGYSTEITPVEDCKELAMFNSYVYDVPMPASGSVTITPGNQPATTLDATKVASANGMTVFYAREGDGIFKVSVISDGKDAAVAEAK